MFLIFVSFSGNKNHRQNSVRCYVPIWGFANNNPCNDVMFCSNALDLFHNNGVTVQS